VAKPERRTLNGLPYPINIEKVPLKEHFGVYIPNQYYFAYEPLPLEWMRMITRSEVFHQQRAFKTEAPAGNNHSNMSTFGMKGVRSSQKENNGFSAVKQNFSRRASAKILDQSRSIQPDSRGSANGKGGHCISPHDEASTFDEDKLLDDELKEYDRKLYSRIL
jgi:hypothetical protein